MKVRQDAWSSEDDLLLAQSVLQHIQKGSTQVAAFDEVGDQLNRTSAACGYRWNAEVRKHYKKEVEHAKTLRKSIHQEKDNKLTQQKVSHSLALSNDALTSNSDQDTFNDITLSDCINFLKSHEQTKNDHNTKDEQEQLKKENEQLRKKHSELEAKYAQLLQKKQHIEHDYKLLMSMINQAQKMSDDTFPKKYYN
ncbi:prespore-specific regulator [Metabacillus crassostreae]|uniref:RsfA family transcriptional regulator n=1 Tax=Metabacillus crassostreae TaxID=929098 RepID=UPI001EF814CA|nr:RsfA family transcriptional regulator [Metabacillus crassostreae]MBM7605796.1 prespore-specific regulator [Metabacillus crassostreae]